MFEVLATFLEFTFSCYFPNLGSVVDKVLFFN